jgi:hypothetical protein
VGVVDVAASDCVIFLKLFPCMCVEETEEWFDSTVAFSALDAER